MERYRWNSNCDGESGRCLADIIPDADGDYVLFADAAAELDRLHAEMADLRAAFLTLREMYESREARIGAAHAEHIARMESTLVAVSKKMTEREAALENSKSRLAGAAGEIHKLRCMTPEEIARARLCLRCGVPFKERGVGCSYMGVDYGRHLWPKNEGLNND